MSVLGHGIWWRYVSRASRQQHSPTTVSARFSAFVRLAINHVHGRRDTVVIPAESWTILRFVADNPGYWTFHCRMCIPLETTLFVRSVHRPLRCRYTMAHGKSFVRSRHTSILTLPYSQSAGLLFQFNVLPSKSAQFDIPQYMLDQCSR